MKFKTGFLICIAVIIAVTIVFFFLSSQTNLDFVKTGKCVFQYGNASIQEDLSAEETAQICAIFKGRFLYQDNLSCGFSEDIAVVFNDDQTFCIAQDTCPVVYWKEKDRYFRITETQKEQLHSILEAHEFKFPCV